MAGMFDQDPAERMAQLDAQEAALNGGAAAPEATAAPTNPGTTSLVFGTQTKPVDDLTPVADDEPKKFAPKAKEVPEVVESEVVEEATPEVSDDYFGIDDEELGFRIPQVDEDGATAALAKKEAGEDLSESEEFLISQKEFKDELAGYGLDWNKTTVEYYKNGGKLTTETLEDYYKVFPKSMVDNWMVNRDIAYAAEMQARSAGSDEKAAAAKEDLAAKAVADEAAQEAEKKQSTKIVTDAVGGKANLDALNAWIINGGINADELTAVNDLLANADMSKPSDVLAMQSVMERLYAKYEVAEGREEPLITGDAPAASSAEKPLSKAEFQAIFRTPEYQKGGPYAAEIDRRRALGQAQGL